jgi:hypothetical protein
MKTPIKNLFGLLILLTLLYACTKEAGDPGSTTTNTTITVKLNNVDTTLFFKVTTNGTSIQLFPDTIYSNVVGDSAKAIASGEEFNPFSFIVRLNTKTKPISYTYPNSGGIGFIYDTASGNISSANYRNIVKVKSYSYGKIATKTGSGGINGARVFYTDNNGIVWASDKGTADQTGSSFIVNAYFDYSDPKAVGTYKKIRATFSCKVYDGFGNFKQFTNGTFSGKMMNY